MPTIGLKRTTHPGTLYPVNAGGQRAQAADSLRMPVSGWITHLGAYFGKTGASNPTVTLALWQDDKADLPRVGQTNAYQSATTITDTTGGVSYELPVVGGALPVMGGVDLAIGALATGADAGIGALAGNQLTNGRLLVRNGLTQPPSNPFAPTLTLTNYTLATWAVYAANRAPAKPTTGLAPSGTGSSTTPPITAFFVDADATDGYGDELTRYSVQVMRNGVLVYNTTREANNQERANAMVNTIYAGSALAAGDTITTRVILYDRLGASSGWSDWYTYTIPDAGSMTPTAPTGKQEAVTGLTFTGTYAHSASLDANAVEVELWRGGVKLKTSPTIALSPTKAPGSAISVTQAQATFALAYGIGDYAFRMRARDTTNAWSPWSVARPFSTNAIPTRPAAMSPANGRVVTTPPLLSFVASDADDSVATGLVASARLKNATTGAIIKTVVPTLRAGTTDRWDYQVTVGTSQDIPAQASGTSTTYTWDAQLFDGTVYSGYSPEQTFTYANGPEVAITAPTEGQVITTSTPTITWTTTAGANQVNWDVDLYTADGETLVFTTMNPGYPLFKIETATSFSFPPGKLEDGVEYGLIVSSRDGLSSIWGYSALRRFTLDYPTPPGLLNVQASPGRSQGDPDTPTSILVTADASTYAPEDVRAITIARRPNGAPVSDEIILYRSAQAGQVRYTDHHPASNVEYLYSVWQTIDQGTDTLEGVRVEAIASVDLPCVVLVAVTDPSLRVALRFDAERGWTGQDNSRLVLPLGGSKPRMVSSPARYRVLTGTYNLITDAFGQFEDAATVHARLLAMAEARPKITLSYRDERGDVVFCGFSGDARDFRRMEMYDAPIELTEVEYSQAVSAS